MKTMSCEMFSGKICFVTTCLKVFINFSGFLLNVLTLVLILEQ